MSTTQITLGLTSLTDEQLTHALRALHQGRLPCPFKRSDLLACGFNPLAERGDVLFGLPQEAVKAALVVAIAERKRAAELESKLRLALTRLQDQLQQAEQRLEQLEGER